MIRKFYCRLLHTTHVGRSATNNNHRWPNAFPFSIKCELTVWCHWFGCFVVVWYTYVCINSAFGQNGEQIIIVRLWRVTCMCECETEGVSATKSTLINWIVSFNYLKKKKKRVFPNEKTAPESSIYILARHQAPGTHINIQTLIFSTHR